jgi:hypothetical protein
MNAVTPIVTITIPAEKITMLKNSTRRNCIDEPGLAVEATTDAGNLR